MGASMRRSRQKILGGLQQAGLDAAPRSSSLPREINNPATVDELAEA